MAIESGKLKRIIEAALFAAGKPLNLDRLGKLFEEDERPSNPDLKQALASLLDDYKDRGVNLVEVGNGWRFQSRQEFALWLQKLWEERPAKYSRASLETLSLIAYRQPVTRGEIEQIRGVSVSSNIIKSMLEREWIRVVGHRDVPGRPALFATTKNFLDYFNLKSLEDLPTLSEIKDLESLDPQLKLKESETSAENPQASSEPELGEHSSAETGEQDHQQSATENLDIEDGSDESFEEAPEALVDEETNPTAHQEIEIESPKIH
jgi:segregation and condensation protein B